MNKFCHDAAYELDERAKLMTNTNKLFPQGLNLESFGIVMTVKMKQGTNGHIFTMYSDSSSPLLALKASPLQLKYKNKVIDLDVEEYIKNEMWHTIAIAVSRDAIEVLVDCVSVSYKQRKLDQLPLGIIRDGQTTLGQRFTGESFLVCLIIV